jgi:very-long-chain enoyl-CoA reductase
LECWFPQLTPTTSVRELKRKVHGLKKSLCPERQALRLEPKGRTLKEDESVKSLGLRSGSKLYVKDLGPQIGWKTVFLAEYAGPLFVYLCMYQRPWLFYGDGAGTLPVHHAVQ